MDNVGDYVNDILICTNCASTLICYGDRYYCNSCKNEYKTDRNGVLSITNNQLESEKIETENLYNKLNCLKKKNAINKYSMFLNYGYLHSATTNLPISSNETSISLIKKLCSNIYFTNKKVLDVGCGRGGCLFYLQNQYSLALAVGIDISYENILFCNTRTSKARFIRADAENIPFAKETFDIVINIESALHYPNLFEFYDEVYRVLKQTGIFIYADIIDFTKKSTIQDYLSSKGFNLIRSENISLHVLNSMKRRKSVNILFDHNKMLRLIEEGKKLYMLYVYEKV